MTREQIKSQLNALKKEAAINGDTTYFEIELAAKEAGLSIEEYLLAINQKSEFECAELLQAQFQIDNPKFYTGIGSRETPYSICLLMQSIATRLQNLGYILRTGDARGADSAFTFGAPDPTRREIYTAKDASPKAEQLASTLHPAWYRCNEYARKLHARNCMQVLGKDLNTPSRFVICWTPNALAVGGTATAINLAKQRGIKVYNLADVNTFSRLKKFAYYK